MGLSLKDFQDFVLLWIQKRTGVHHGPLTIAPTMVRHCLCCQASGTYAHSTNGLCLACSEEQKCLACTEPFTPSQDSVGSFCSTCWARLESAWTKTFEEKDAGVAETEVRSLVMRARPVLSGCSHR